jgi:hypothetical protein
MKVIELLQKARSELSKAEELYKSPRGDYLKHCVKYLLSSMNYIASAVLERTGSVERDYLILHKRIDDEELNEEFNELYFYLRNLSLGDFKELSGDLVRIDGWKSSILLRREDFLLFISKVREILLKFEAKLAKQ